MSREIKNFIKDNNLKDFKALKNGDTVNISIKFTKENDDTIVHCNFNLTKQEFYSYNPHEDCYTPLQPNDMCYFIRDRYARIVRLINNVSKT